MLRHKRRRSSINDLLQWLLLTPRLFHCIECSWCSNCFLRITRRHDHSFNYSINDAIIQQRSTNHHNHLSVRRHTHLLQRHSCRRCSQHHRLQRLLRRTNLFDPRDRSERYRTILCYPYPRNHNTLNNTVNDTIIQRRGTNHHNHLSVCRHTHLLQRHPRRRSSQYNRLQRLLSRSDMFHTCNAPSRRYRTILCNPRR